jgi:hypothetical protein
MFVTISVTPNNDGTITVTCGNDSVIIGTPAKPKTASPEPPILWPNGGAVATLIADKKAKTVVVRVPPRKDLAKAITEQHKLHKGKPTPTIFQFQVEGTKPVSVEKINKTLSDLGNPDWMGTQIMLTGVKKNA